MKNKDLTVGNPTTVLWKFCLPLFGSVVFQQLYNIADSWVAGRFIGENALAAVGNSYEVTLIFIAFAFGCNIGSSVIVARYFGSKNFRDMKTSISTTIIGSASLCAALMLIGIILTPQMLDLINTPEAIMEDSKLYLDIYILGLPFLFFYNIATGIFASLGDSITPFLFLALSSTSNIAVDILFVSTFKMGVAGVAWATFLCQGISCILSWIIILRRLGTIKIDEKAPIFSKKILKQIAIIAIPSIFQQSFVSVGNIIIQGIINSFGASIIAGYSAAIKLNNLVITSFTTLANGISSYTSQNLGAKQYERIKKGFASGIKIIWTITLPIAALYLAFPSKLIGFFISGASDMALKSGIEFLRIVSPFYFIISIKLISDGVLRGSGQMKPFMLSTFSDLILRVVLSAILSINLGYIGIWLSWPIGWSIGTILSVLFYKKETNRLPQLSA